ncbi:MAG TPA: hypothetical protein VLT33_49650 [Labilithrix sp.]|nr:hypothetical protein [Labilithrix sp.]
MAKNTSNPLTALTVGLVVALTGAAVACSDDAANTLGNRAGSSGNSSGSNGSSGGDGGSSGNVGGPPAEEVLFRAVEAEFKQKCGNACHDTATYKPTPPAFLAGPDSYKSVKAQPGVVVADYYQSSILNKGAHAGPAVGDDPTFEAKIIEWLKMESAVIQSQKKPSTDAVALKSGPNDLDLTKAATGGLTGVHLLFDASLVGGILSLNNIKLHAAAGTDVHLYKPRFIKVLAKANAGGQTEIPDGAETFSNTDQTVPGGADTILGPGAAFFTAAGWAPFDFGADKIRVEVDKLEPGKVSVIDKPKVCKDVAGFTANVLPSLRGAAGGFNLNCANCHGGGLAGLSLNGADQTVVCNQVLGKLNEADLTKSLMVTKVTAGNAHNGGSITNIAGFTAVFVNNKAVFF